MQDFFFIIQSFVLFSFLTAQYDCEGGKKKKNKIKTMQNIILIID